MSKQYQRLIIIVLAVILAAVSLAAFWDLYGREHFAKATNTASTTVEPQSTTPGNRQKPVSTPVDEAKQNIGTKKEQNVATPATSAITTDYQACLANTPDMRTAKDCCDCLTSADAETRKTCRDDAATYDFTQNTKFSSFTIPSILGKDGDYSSCTSTGSVQECKQCCDSPGQYACGDTQYCRTACSTLEQTTK